MDYVSFILDNGTSKIEMSVASPFFVEKITGLSDNDVTISDNQAVGQIGATLSAKSINPKNITIDGSIVMDIDTNRKKMLDTVLPAMPIRLTYKYKKDSYYVDCIATKTPLIADTAGDQAFQMVLYCPYPYWTHSDNSVTDIASITPSFILPFNTGDTWYLSKFTDSVFKNVINYGNIETGFTVIFTAKTDVVNPEIYHVEKRKIIKLKYTLLAGESINVCTIAGKKGASINQNGIVGNAFKYLTIESDLNLTLSAGDNTIRYGADTNKEGLRVSIEAPKGVRAGV